MQKITVLGAGSWGTALSMLLASKGYKVTLWGREEDGIEDIKKHRINEKFLPSISILENIYPTTSREEAITNSDLLVIAVPSQAVREVIEDFKHYINNNIYIVNTSKGIEITTQMRMSQVIKDVIGEKILERYGVLSGPSHAEEVIKNIPTAVTVAAYKKETAFLLQSVFMSTSFRVYTNPDVAGVELGGALKNIVALATGMSRGLGFGDNTTAALMTRGLTEVVRMGIALGADPRTFAGLSGIGDLIVTCNSNYSRNNRAGNLLGQGKSLEETLESIGMVVEGIHTTRVVYKIAQDLNIEMPITTACYNIIYNNKNPKEEVENLMQRRKKHEIEEIVNNIDSW
ncbi:Glycerol-3-phosphate dehydrogenase [NAD(P)+] [Candidatus Syntrophocurvum alkaliphilum]|uniref:Glycerol-3-phosphate dehydrogenase [NAD(P)+] n=1 Tax=Candidatus Syntrophocurvum alkaliphilum TaxID=2293317 RepID=A0A6I6DFY9_9FIRM|nr:NAD(P)H-dependent glycerol-3-phosphate dehydrogenase [Candidatus Syntrophocurvum alkaliphilum]QGT99832.1 Glycerol-3-phosphate dehydrogenase [NAD(P)+] [Candidatus Syntrophocurvum alkaliphilum]